MKAVTLVEYSAKGIEIRDVPIPVPQTGQVLVQVEASPINPADQATAYGVYATGRQKLPLILGMEGSGLVVASGGGEIADSLVGKRVAFHSKTCGAWAEFNTVDAEFCAPLIDGITF